jgi:putative endonuclease
MMAQIKAQNHFVYIVRCANGSLYTGYSTDVEKRVATHNAGKGARYTRAHLPVTLCAIWTFASKGDALRAERVIKGLPRAKKVQLIEQAMQEEGWNNGRTPDRQVEAGNVPFTNVPRDHAMADPGPGPCQQHRR